MCISWSVLCTMDPWLPYPNGKSVQMWIVTEVYTCICIIPRAVLKYSNRTYTYIQKLIPYMYKFSKHAIFTMTCYPQNFHAQNLLTDLSRNEISSGMKWKVKLEWSQFTDNSTGEYNIALCKYKHFSNSLIKHSLGVAPIFLVSIHPKWSKQKVRVPRPSIISLLRTMRYCLLTAWLRLLLFTSSGWSRNFWSGFQLIKTFALFNVETKRFQQFTKLFLLLL